MEQPAGERAVRWREDAPSPPVPDVSISTSSYTDPERYAKELEIMRQSWLLVCHSSEVCGKGDTFLAEQLGETVAIVRQANGTLDAWHAVCAHRQTALLTGPQKAARRFVCPYHHWTYDLAGRLVGVTERECFRPERIRDLKLPRVHVAEAAGWVWINLAEDDPEPLDEWLGELLDEWAPYEMEKSVLMAPYIDVVIPSNWKRAVEAFIEVYHVGFLHRESTPPDVMRTELASFDLFERHSMLISPLTQGIDELAASGNHQAHALVNYLAFPASAINNLPMQHQAYTFAPLDIDTTRMRLWLLYPEGQDTDERVAGAEAEIGYISAVFEEDVFIARQQTRSNGTGVDMESIIGTRECRIAHLHQNIERRIKSMDREKG